MQSIRSQISLGNLPRAEQLCRQRLEEEPNDIQAGFLLAFVLWSGSRTEEALLACRGVLARSPVEPGLLNDLGNLFRELGAFSESLEALDRSLEIRPGDPGTRYNRALTLDALGRDREALQVIDGFVPDNPFFPKARFLGGTIRQDFGDMAGAEADFRACIEAAPDHYKAWYALAFTRRFESGDGLIDELGRQASRHAGDPVACCHYLFALAKVLDDAGQYDDAGEQVVQANQLVGARYRKSEIEARLELLCGHFRSPADPAVDSTSKPVPVFIVGLPRSGSTLVESRLDRHPEIQALGELHALPALISDFHRIADDGELRELGNRYLDALPPISGQTTQFLDKMPGNFWRLGHIWTMFPDAKIIFCRREPRDVAISNFFTLYGEGNSFSYNLEHLAHYTACHEAVMAHWTSLAGDRIFNLDYAEFVRHPRRCMAGLAEHLGLEWTEEILEVPAGDRRIRTASTWQARQDIYTSSVGRWQNYPRLADEFMKHYESHSRRLRQVSG